MTERIPFYPKSIAPHPRNPVNAGHNTNAVSRQLSRAEEDKSFGEVLQERLVRFSHHAELRLQQRGIKLAPDQLSKLDSAIDKAAAKGAKDSLIVMQNMALIVNVKNRTVVTAMDGSTLQDNVFTKIDSAVILS